ncbi:MAG: hypothetical protein ACOVPA_16565 [Rubrivivax sp.]|jgi:hypothetical protein|nr:hypothetical protein [Rubrivivax sp.]
MRSKIPFLAFLRAARPEPGLGDLSNAIAAAAWKSVSREAGTSPSRVLVYARIDPEVDEVRLSTMILYTRRTGDVVESLHGPGNSDVMNAVDAQRRHLQTTGQAAWFSLTQRIEAGRFETDMTYETTPALSLDVWDTGQWLKREHFGQKD